MNHAVAAMSGEDAPPAPAYPTKSISEDALPIVRRRSLSLLPISGLMFLLGVGAATLWNRHVQNAPVVVVNGEAVSAAEFAHRVELAAGANTLQQIINEKLQAQLAAKQNVLPLDREVEAKYREQSALPGFADTLKQTRQTPEDAQAALRVGMISQALVSKGVSVTDEDARHFYEANVDARNPQARYYRPETARIAAILSDKPDDIKNALHELASGTAFTQVAARYSKDQSKANGGLLPPIRRGSMDAQKFPGMENALMSLKPGQQIDTYKAAGALWIIRCVEHADEVKIPYEKVREECRQGALLAKGAQVNGQNLQAELQAQRRDAKIEILRPEYKDSAGGK